MAAVLTLPHQDENTSKVAKRIDGAEHDAAEHAVTAAKNAWLSARNGLNRLRDEGIGR